MVKEKKIKDKKKKSNIRFLSNKKCWQCKKYTVTIYKNGFGGYSETCSNKCGPELLGKQLQLF